MPKSFIGLPKQTFHQQGEDGSVTWDNANPYVGQSPNAEPDSRIDYVWLRAPGAAPLAPSLDGGGEQGRRARVVLNTPPFASDHYGILAEF